MNKSLHLAIVAAATVASSVTAHADIKVGVVLSETGPAASLGIPEQKTVRLFPKQIGGQNIQYIIRDDASDPTAAVKAAKELIDADNVDVVWGPRSLLVHSP